MFWLSPSALSNKIFLEVYVNFFIQIARVATSTLKREEKISQMSDAINQGKVCVDIALIISKVVLIKKFFIERGINIFKKSLNFIENFN